MKVFHLTYYSLSGVISHIILKNVFKNIRYMTCGYDKLPKKIEEIYLEDEQLISTNFSLTQEQYDTLTLVNGKMIYIDHHFNSEKLQLNKGKNYINRNFSSCLLTFKIFEKFLKDDVKESLKKLAICGNAYDMWLIKNESFVRGYYLNELFWKYNFSLFVEKFENGIRKFQQDEIDYVKYKVNSKKKRIKDLEMKEIKSKNSVLFILKENEYDLINDIPLTYNQYDVYFIYLGDKQKLTIKHKLENVNLNETLEKLFKGRDDILSYSGDCMFGTLNYNRVTDSMFVNDLKTILNRM